MQRGEKVATASDGAKVFRRRWAPAGSSKATVCLVHGVCEHSGRYERIAEALTTASYAVSAFDLRGHGRSSGQRGDARLAATIRDIDELVGEERKLTGKVFLYGQSLGGLCALAYALEHGSRVDGVVASAPVLHTALREQRSKVLLVRTLGRLLPALGVRPGLDDTKLMRDDAVLADRRQDPLVHDRVSAGLARDVLDTCDRVLREAERFAVPLPLVHGRADEINFLRGSEEMARKVKGDCTLHVYDGVRHHPHNDPERNRIFGDVVAWLDRHV